jgi:alpha-galactosidase
MPDSRLNITIVGGGSVAWTPNIVKDIMLTPALANARFVLYDINKGAAELTTAYLRKAAKQLGVKARFVATDRPATAFRAADYVIITISTGGLDAMAKDIAIPEKFGILHTVGDTSGPGGWARLIRNFDVFVDLAQHMHRYCPDAVVLNYTNPMATLTDVLCRLHAGPVVGLCHGLFENLRFIKAFYDLGGEDDIAVNYAGLNHFFWITEAKARGTDIIADLNRRMKSQSFSDLLADVHEDAMGFASPKREVATELMRLTGVMPYLGDRHTCEFFSQYIASKANLKRYKLVRTSIAERRDAFRKRRADLKRMIDGAIDPIMLERSRETAADIIDAHSHGRVFIDVGNVPNIGQVADLPPGVVVETAVRVDANGFHPIAFGSLPDAVRGMVEPYAHVYAMTVDACFAGDLPLAMQALRLDPVCATLAGDAVEKMGKQLLRAHSKWITCFNK